MAAQPWQNKLMKPMFRGIPFYIDTISDTGGRRVTTHIIPEKDGVLNEDTGMTPRSFSISGHVTSSRKEDYFIIRDRLLKAFETKGSGIFRHPYRGDFNVRAQGYTLNESSSVGNVLTFSVTFVEEDKYNRTTGSRVINPSKKVSTAKTRMVNASSQAFRDSLESTPTPAQAVRTFNNNVDKAISKIGDARKVVGGAEEFKRELYNSIGKGIALIYTTEDLIQSTINLLDFGTVPERVAQLDPSQVMSMFDELQTLYYSLDNPSDAMSKAYWDFRSQIAVSSAIGLVTGMTFVTYGEVTTVRNQMVSMLDDMEGKANTIEMLSAIQDARSAVTDFLDYSTKQLSYQKDILPGVFSNSLSFTYNTYGNLDKEETIVYANNIDYPGFLPASQTIRVVL